MPETNPMLLFVCAHNKAQSRMAEALLRHKAGEAPTEVHPLVRLVLTDSELNPRAVHAVGSIPYKETET